MKEYYKILNTNKNADYVDIINSYNDMIKPYNIKKKLTDADKNNIKDIKEAFFVLGSYQNRRSYDNSIEGYKKSQDNFNERIFFRPELNYQHNTDYKLKNTNSDLMNNKKNRHSNDDINYNPI